MVKAWIVAIEKYGQATGQNPPGDPLDIEAAVGTWALDLAEFLVEKANVPKGNVTLNLSLAPRNDYSERLRKLGIEWKGATQAELQNSAFGRLQGSKDDTLLIYWVGHGIRDERARYLLCADSRSPGNLVALTADSLLRHLRDEGFPGTQMGFFEACAQKHPSPHTFEFSSDDRGSQRQFFYFAASANEFAPADLDRPGFSSEVLKHLKAHGQVPQNPPAFFQELNQAFEDLHACGLLQSRPFDLQYTRGSGDQWSRPGYRQAARLPVSPESICLYDRGFQVNALEDLIAETSDRRNRPLAFIVSGPDPEYHEALHERLSQIPLPRRLLGPGVTGSKLRRLILPDEPARDESATLNRVRTRLDEALDTSVDSALDKLPNGLTYVRVRIGVDRRLTRVEPLVKALLDVLNGAADLPGEKAVCVGISLEWEANGPSQRLLQTRFSEGSYSRLRFRVLPNLDPPRRSDARRWAELLETVKPGLLQPTKWDALARIAAGLFVEGDRMPMRDLHERFTKLFD